MHLACQETARRAGGRAGGPAGWDFLAKPRIFGALTPSGTGDVARLLLTREAGGGSRGDPPGWVLGVRSIAGRGG